MDVRKLPQPKDQKFQPGVHVTLTFSISMLLHSNPSGEGCDNYTLSAQCLHMLRVLWKNDRDDLVDYPS